MAFMTSVQKYSGAINKVEFGTDKNALILGGENTLPFYTFDGDSGSGVKIGLEIIDIYPEKWLEELKKLYGSAAEKPAQWAKYVEELFVDIY